MTNKSIRDYINLIENAQKEGVVEAKSPEEFLGQIRKMAAPAATKQTQVGSKFDEVYDRVEVGLMSQGVITDDLEYDIERVLKSLKIKPKPSLIDKLVQELHNRGSQALNHYDDPWGERGVAEGISLDALSKVANIIPSFAEKIGAAAKQESKETLQMLQILKLKMQGKATPEQVQWMNKQWRDLAIIAVGVGLVGHAAVAGAAAHGIAAGIGHGAKDALLHSLGDIGLEAAAEVLSTKFGIDIVKKLSHSLTTSTGQGIEHSQEKSPQQYGVSSKVAAKNQQDLERKFQQAKMGFGGMAEGMAEGSEDLRAKLDLYNEKAFEAGHRHDDQAWRKYTKLAKQIADQLGLKYKVTGYGLEILKQGVDEGSGQLSIQQLATISDEALDKAYGYGRSTPGNTFGWQANLMSAAYAKKMIDAGVTDIEKISDAIHKGWNVTAQKFVQNPDHFDDTEKLRQAGKLEAKLQQRAKLMKINYAQLDNEEQEKDRVVARALLQAIRGQ